jgi:transcriptional regulator with XRE-family HTH domain
MDFQKLIAELLEHGMTQNEIGEKAGTRQSTISDIYRKVIKRVEYNVGASLIELHKEVVLKDKRKNPDRRKSRRSPDVGQP